STGYRVPLPDSVDPAEAVPRPPVAAPDMPHWTEPPTGEVPRVLAGDEPEGEDNPWSGFATRAPRWRDQGSDWDEADFDDVSALADDETRLGALDETRTEHSDLYSFDDPDPAYVEPEEVMAAVVSVFVAVYRRGAAAYPLVLALFVVLSFLWCLFGVVKARPTINVAGSLLAFLWVGGLGSFAALMLTLPQRRGIAVLLGA